MLSLSCLAAALLAAIPSLADPVVSFREEIAVGENVTSTEVDVWIGPDSIARIGGGTRLLLDLPGDEVLLVNDLEKTVRVLPVITMERTAPIVTDTGEVADIGGWQARRFDVEIEPVPGETIPVSIWMSEDTGMSRESYLSYARATDQGLGLAAAIAALPGIPVLVELTNGPVRSRTELLGVSDDDPPEGVYDVPGDYTQQ